MSSLVCGFGAGVLQIVPLAKSLGCCLIIPLAAFFSLVLDRKANPALEKISSKKALMFGLITGLYAALFGSAFDLLITLVTKNNDLVSSFTQLQQMINSFPLSNDLKNEVVNLFQKVRNDIIQYGFSPIYAFSIIINNVLVNSVFGIAGGLIGAQIINKGKNNQSNT